jgi:hypothetical protein
MQQLQAAVSATIVTLSGWRSREVFMSFGPERSIVGRIGSTGSGSRSGTVITTFSRHDLYHSWTTLIVRVKVVNIVFSAAYSRLVVVAVVVVVGDIICSGRC